MIKIYFTILLVIILSSSLQAGERYEIVGSYNTGDNGGFKTYLVIYDKIETKFVVIEVNYKDRIKAYKCIKSGFTCKEYVETEEWKKIKIDLFGDSYFGIKPTPTSKKEEAANDNGEQKYDWQ